MTHTKDPKEFFIFLIELVIECQTSHDIYHLKGLPDPYTVHE
jgi:hypothetical protein